MASEFETLKYARMAHGLSQIELAKRAGISRQTLSAIESGAYQPGVLVALKLAREPGLSVEELFGAQDKEGRRVFADYVPESPEPRGRRERPVYHWLACTAG
jgi:putative transcriptional regulator